MTTSNDGRDAAATSGDSGRTSAGVPGHDDSAMRDRAVHTGVPPDQAAPADTSSQATTSANDQSTNQASNRSQTMQVSCPEPTNAQPGQCFSRVLYPAKFSEQQVQEVVRPEYEKITYTDPVYQDVQEQVLVREAYTREIEVPALYDTFYEQVLEKPAGKVWKKGRGAQERVDPATGEIYCLVDEPAVYRTVEKRELKRAAGTRTEQVPAEYTTRTVRKLVTPPQQVRTTVPAEYASVTKKSLAGADSCEYAQVLCQDNATETKIHEVEQALQSRGYEVNNDGLDDEDLANALRQFQEKQGLPQTGLMTARTLDALGVALEPVQKPVEATGAR